MSRLAFVVVTALATSLGRPALAQADPDGASPDARERIDRIVVRWHAKATGGVRNPQFITARELAFSARLEAMTDKRQVDPFLDKHVRAGLQRIIAESILARLPVDPKPQPQQVAENAEAARRLLYRRIGPNASTRVEAARTAEGITPDELNALLRRRARAAWYLDKTVAPMLSPTELDLREAHANGETPFTEYRFEDIERQLRQWYVASRLSAALDRYFRNVRSRVNVAVVDRLPRARARKRR